MQRFLWLMQRPIFWQLTILIHGFILLIASLLYITERDLNPQLNSFLDSLYWAVATATTVGYGDITAVSILGKWLSMALMILGTLFSALYTALFAAALMKPELDGIERELIREEETVKQLEEKMESLSGQRPK
jgi:voltage-gated potassium channel Kch